MLNGYSRSQGVLKVKGPNAKGDTFLGYKIGPLVAGQMSSRVFE